MLGKNRSRKIGVHIDMTPMVDVMMLLVIFFMMSTAFVAVYPGFTVALPQASSAAEQNEQIVVWIGKDAQIAVDGQTINKEELIQLLKSRSNGNISVSIRADKAVSHGVVVEIMDEIRQAGIFKMAIAIEQKEL